MDKNINFINRLRISITSIRQYNELIKDTLSKAIIYSLMLSLLVGSFLGAFSFAVVGTMQKNIEDIISSDEFKFILKDGILDFENSPIKREEGRSIVYIDTNISLDNVDSIRKVVVHKDESFAILKDGISYRINGNEYNYKFSELPLIEKIDNDIVLKALSIIGIVKYLAFFASILLTYIKFMINAFILSIGGIILNNLNGLNLKYRDIFKICIYATTLPTILGAIIPIGTFSLLISGMYLILVVNYMRSEIQL